MTLSTVLGWLIPMALGWLVKHYALIEKLLGIAAAPSPVAPVPAGKPVVLPLPTVSLGNHPVLSDAVNAAIKQAVNDAVSGHLASLQGEIEAAAKAAAAAVAADLQKKS